MTGSCRRSQRRRAPFDKFHPVYIKASERRSPDTVRKNKIRRGILRKKVLKLYHCNEDKSNETTQDHCEGWFNPDGTEITFPEMDESVIPELDDIL